MYIENFKDFLKCEAPENLMKGNQIKGVNSIVLKDVSFSYPEKNNLVLSGINISILPGQSVALVGENGAGKTTLTKLLTGLYEPTFGEVLINGIKLSEVNLQVYRKCVGIVFQDHKLFKLH
ncbi:MAG: ATP-binding cassette domain-containing protein [Clostridiales bacterium]|nr:ATP-binding cassette domain-containing protein [Clostridiales bacterium]